MKPDNSDNICIDQQLVCSFHLKQNIVGKSKEELDLYYFLPINKYFQNLSSGGYERSIYGATSGTILHTLLLGLCEYRADGMQLIFTQSGLDLIFYVMLGIYEDSRRQSDGLMYVTSLKAEGRFARV